MTFQVSYPIPSKKNNRIVLKNGLNIPSKEFRNWHRSHIDELKRIVRGHGTFSHPVSISLGISYGDFRRRDLDNSLTSVIDLVKDSGLIVDDDWSHVAKVTAEAVNFGEGYAIVTISPVQLMPWWRKIIGKVFK